MKAPKADAEPNGSGPTGTASGASSLDLRELLHALQAVSSGDFSVRLPGDMTGLEGHALLAGYLAAAGPDLPALERIRAMGRAYYRFGLEHPKQYALMFNVRADETPRHEALVREMETLMLLRRVVEEGIARGEVRADLDPMVTTNALWAQIHGVTALTVSRLLAETTHGDEASVVDAVLDATAAWITPQER